MSTIAAIICVKDQKFELKKSLQSVLCQTEAPDELIIVDSSCDNSVKNYIQDDLDGKVKYLLLEGLDVARYDEKQMFQIGLKHASCDFAAFLFAGDEWHPDKIKIIKNKILENHTYDFYISSFFQRICLSNQAINFDKICSVSDGFFALFFLWFAPSAIVAKRIVALSLSELTGVEISALKICFISQSLSTHYHGAQKDVFLMQRIFWKNNNQKILELGALKQAAFFCVNLFQNAQVSMETLDAFANNVELPLPAAFSLMEFLLVKKQRNYSFARNWLEMKISGRSVEQNLKARGIFSVLIYGAGRHGTLLFNDLKASNIKILGWIDHNPKCKEYLELPVYGLDELDGLSSQPDAIIVTPFLEFDDISYKLKSLGFNNSVPLDEITM